jgi:hypothetical protein
MRTRFLAVSVLMLSFCTLVALRAQITSNPIPAPVVKRGIALEIRDVVRSRIRVG